MLTSLPLGFEAACSQAAALGFAHVDIVGLSNRPEQHREALAESGLVVSCAALGRDLASGQTLDAAALDARRAALEAVKLQIADAARLGATRGYVVPGLDTSTEALDRFADACIVLADFAGQRMIQLCVEHCPGRALPSVAATLAWLDKMGQDRLKLLLDVGHCLISQEDPARVIAQAGTRLGYVHLDDNDGVGDLHWPLLSGQLTEKTLRAALDALWTEGYRGALALELNPQNPEPVEALRQGKLRLECYLAVTDR
jgi:sugar phosphate isomerase/epimerase